MKINRSYLPLVYVLASFFGHLTGVLFPPSIEVYGGGANAYVGTGSIAYFLETVVVIPFGQIFSILGFVLLDNSLGSYFSVAALIVLGSGILFLITRKLQFLVLFALCLFFISTRALYFTNMGLGV